MFVPMVPAKTGRQPAKRCHRGEAMAAKTIREQRMLDALATRFSFCYEAKLRELWVGSVRELRQLELILNFWAGAYAFFLR